MAGGLLALLDDVALIARTAAASADDVGALVGKTTAKSAGVVIDDAAVTPGYLEGAKPARELPMIWRITKGSLRNKLIIILPILLLLSWLAPWSLTPILMIGGTYLCYEGAHKVIGLFTGHGSHDTPVQESGEEAEDKLVRGAITTDLILSAEIMVIAMNGIVEEAFWTRVIVLILVAIVITIAVYGAVGLLVKLDDIGLGMIKRGNAPGLGRGLVKAMPIILGTIGIVGTFAMLWVGGHIIVQGVDTVGLWSWPYETIHHWEEAAGGGSLGWLVNTGASLIAGLLWGLVAYAVIEGVKALLPGKKADGEHAANAVVGSGSGSGSTAASSN